ncbi:MAG TPA: methyltransferase domain-containing protein [Solirubrobacterales bacterium]|nr:methyltransferase domain-containing protein [Solirubrobacterales bacterium]
MSELRSQEEAQLNEPAEAPPIYFDARRELAARYLSGEGLEIGPLHQPLAMPAQATPRYVDRMQVDDLRREYPELADWNLTPVDIVDDGEALLTVAESSQDFIVANHFLEHCENPIRTIETHLGKLRPGGVLFYAVPDKRFTFDFRRQVTPLEHMVADYEEGPERSRAEHYEQWTRLVLIEDGQTEERAVERARELEAKAYSIHMHVWTQAEFLRLILGCRERFGEGFDLEASAQQGIEFMVVLRKRGAMPAPNPPTAPPPPPPGIGTRIWSKLKREVRAARRRRG